MKGIKMKKNLFKGKFMEETTGGGVVLIFLSSRATVEQISSLFLRPVGCGKEGGGTGGSHV